MSAAWFWISCVAAGLCLSCVFVVFLRPVSERATTPRSVVRPWYVRCAWPWVQALCPLCEPLLAWRLRRRLSAALQLAGLHDHWTPAQLVAMQFCVATVGFLLVSGAAALLGASLQHAAVPGGLLAAAGFLWPRHVVHRLGNRRRQTILRQLPFLLDMTTLCVQAGLNLHGALQQAARHGPPGPLYDELHYMLALIRTGTPKMQALSVMAERCSLPEVDSWVAALQHAELMGMSLAPLLQSQSAQRRAERFQRVEKLALEAPVKMLFPLVFCIFPCTFLIIAFPVAVNLLQGYL
ncbi:MAG: type II secretion system F family protein [Burkholderiaceae bacterium]